MKDNKEPRILLIRASLRPLPSDPKQAGDAHIEVALTEELGQILEEVKDDRKRLEMIEEINQIVISDMVDYYFGASVALRKEEDVVIKEMLFEIDIILCDNNTLTYCHNLKEIRQYLMETLDTCTETLIRIEMLLELLCAKAEEHEKHLLGILKECLNNSDKQQVTKGE